MLAVRYDFNILYDEECDDSIDCATHITQFLEDNGLNGFLFERDCPIGGDILDTMFNSIKHSRFTIALMTPQFVRKSWEIYKHKAAFMTLTKGRQNGVSCLLPMAYKLPRDEVREHVRFLVTQKVVQLKDDYRSDSEAKNDLLRIMKIQDVGIVKSKCILQD